MRFTSRWAIATMLPSAIVSTASAMTSGDHCGRRGPRPCTSTRTTAANAVAFGATDMKAVTGVGAPW